MSKIFSCIHLLNFITKMKREKTFAICYLLHVFLVYVYVHFICMTMSWQLVRQHHLSCPAPFLPLQIYCSRKRTSFHASRFGMFAIGLFSFFQYISEMAHCWPRHHNPTFAMKAQPLKVTKLPMQLHSLQDLHCSTVFTLRIYNVLLFCQRL